ncbi:MAG: bile acid:sodium symporter [Gammaproteobacteria bacterium]
MLQPNSRHTIKYFLLWILLSALLGYIQPNLFTLLTDRINILLAIIMFSMGITLTANDFHRVITRPKIIALGVAIQFLIMPLIAWSLTKILNLPPALAVGMIILGSCPGGTASNIICYLALSVCTHRDNHLTRCYRNATDDFALYPLSFKEGT